MKTCFKSIMKVGLVFALFLSLVTTSGTSVLAMGADAPTPPPAKAPKINFFTASPTNISSGKTSTLSWDVVNASKVEIIGLEKSPEEALPLSGNITVWPFETTSYVLIATGAGGTSSKTVTVNVDAKGNVKIDYFKASATQITLGQTVDLSWKTTNATKIKIFGYEKDSEEIYPLEGTLKMWPTATTTYVLQAIGTNGEVASATVTVNVIEKVKPEITSFTATATEVSKGALVTLKWTTSNAVKCTIVTDDGLKLQDLPANGSVSVTPKKTRTYTLIAEDDSKNKAEKSITIAVK